MESMGKSFLPPSSRNHMIIIITPAAVASPPPHNADLPSSAAAHLALPSPANNQSQPPTCFRLLPPPPPLPTIDIASRVCWCYYVGPQQPVPIPHVDYPHCQQGQVDNQQDKGVDYQCAWIKCSDCVCHDWYCWSEWHCASFALLAFQQVWLDMTLSFSIVPTQTLGTGAFLPSSSQWTHQISCLGLRRKNLVYAPRLEYPICPRQALCRCCSPQARQGGIQRVFRNKNL